MQAPGSLALLLPLVGALVACDAPATTPGALADLAAVVDAASAGDGEVDCKDDLMDRALGGVCLHSVSGQLVTEAGAVIAGATITVCANACFYGMTGADGHFVVAIDEYLHPADYSLLAHVNPRRAAYYMQLPAPVGTHITFAAPIAAPLMPADGPRILDDESAQVVHGDGVDLLIEAGTVLFFSVEDTGDMPLGAELRPLRVTDFSKLPFLAGLNAFAAYGFGPFEMDVRTKVRLAFDNATGLPPGTALDVLAQRGLVRGAPPGWRLDVAGGATVSVDGKRIDMDPGTGLDTLTWIALRKKE